MSLWLPQTLCSMFAGSDASHSQPWTCHGYKAFWTIKCDRRFVMFYEVWLRNWSDLEYRHSVRFLYPMEYFVPLTCLWTHLSLSPCLSRSDTSAIIINLFARQISVSKSRHTLSLTSFSSNIRGTADFPDMDFTFIGLLCHCSLIVTQHAHG